MVSRPLISVFLAGFLCAAAATGAGLARAEPAARPDAGASGAQPPPGAGFRPGGEPGKSAKSRTLSAPKPQAEALRAQKLGDLFARLASAADPAEAQPIVLAIQQVWFEIPSDTAKLLMQRAVQSIRDTHYPLALLLLDKIVVLEPGWAEAWNQRATTRFLADDAEGAMADIDRVMKLEPRHFGALAGMGAILQRAGLDKQALHVYERSLSLYPLQPELRKMVDKLKVSVEGRDI